MVLNETYTLSNGLPIPKIGLGTWCIEDDQAAEAVRNAIKAGYRLIDSAQDYHNERGVGEGVRTSGLSRDKIFVTSKVLCTLKTYKEAADSIDETLKKMGLDYIDMMLIHSPQPWAEFGQENRYFEGNKEAWRAMEDAYLSGKIKAIGVSNFLPCDIENIMSSCRIKPMVNQICLYIGNTYKELVDYCQENGILVEAYSPIAHGRALNDHRILDMAEKYNVTPAQLCVRYALQLGTLPLPKAINPEHMKNNTEVDFNISSEDMELLKTIKE